MPKDKEYSLWDYLTMKPSKDAIDEAKKTGAKKTYTAPKEQSTSYLKKQIAEQMRLKKKAEQDAAALKALSGK